MSDVERTSSNASEPQTTGAAPARDLAIGGSLDPLAAPQERGGILIVDDEVFIRKAFQLYFDTIGFSVRVADGGRAALEIFDSEDFALDVVLLDLVMPGIHGLELLKVFKQRRPDVEVIIATGCGSLSSAIEAMRNGAFDYITKPIVNFEDELLKVVEDALHHRRAALRSRRMSDLRGLQGSFGLAFHNLSLFEKFVKLSDIVALWRRQADVAAGARAAEKKRAEVEEFLDSELGIDAGIIFLRREDGEVAPAYSWGRVRAAPVNAQWSANPGLAGAIHGSEVVVFTDGDLQASLLAAEPGKVDESPQAILLPLVLEGVHRGAMLLGLSRPRGETRKAEFLDHGRPYLVIAPALASFFLGAIRGD
jgi:DNA-binding response OmpR family regulator